MFGWGVGRTDGPTRPPNTTPPDPRQAIFALAMTVTIPILSPILALVILMEPRSHPFHQLAAVGLVAVNMMWFFKFMTKYMGAVKGSGSSGSGSGSEKIDKIEPPISTKAASSPRKGSNTVAA